MRQPDANRTGPHVAAQTAAAMTAADAAGRADALAADLWRQDQAFRDALREMQVVENFVNAPEHILGNASTKHGEIAEQVHVGVRRAFDVLHQRTPTATFEGVGRLAVVDYVDGGDVQSKYYKNLPDTLDGVASHADRNADFAMEGGRYHIPQDQFEQLAQLRQAGTIDGLSDHTVASIQRQVESLEQKTGRPLDQLVAPGEASYDEVQQGRVHDTIQDAENVLAEEHEALQDFARGAHGPSLDGAVAGVGSGVAAGAGVRFAQAVWDKIRAGRNPFRGEFSAEDWKDVGLHVARGAAAGAVAGSALYLLTNATDLAAPFAGALVSSLIGIGNLVGQYRTEKIDAAQFVDLSLTVASDAALVALGAAAGQIIIPLPLLGAFLGSTAGKIVAAALGCVLGETAPELVQRIEACETETSEPFADNDALRSALDKVDAWVGGLTDLARIAFDEAVNVDLRLSASVRMAQAVAGPDHPSLRSTAETDAYIQE